MQKITIVSAYDNHMTTDICIVGAGPAGASASLFLSKMGIDHLILDAATFPRDKVCGDGLDLKVFRVLHHLDPSITTKEVFENQDFIQAWGARAITRKGRHIDYYYKPKPGEPDYPLFWTSKRLHFDHFLIKKIKSPHADFREGTKVTEIQRENGGWRILANQNGTEIEIRAKLLLGADGDHSVVLRSLQDRKIERRHYAGTLRQYWKGINGFHEKNLIEVYFPSGLPMSYFYMFPLPNGEANVGYGMVSELASKGKHNLKELLNRFIYEDPIIAPRFKDASPLETPIGWGIPMASRQRQNFGDGYLLLGDAASLVCPTSGEGIGTSMISGYIAAHFVQKALQLNRFDAEVFSNYDREVYRRLQNEIQIYRVLMQYTPWSLYEWGLNNILSNPYSMNWFQKEAGSWLRTAFEKPIQLTL